MDDKTRLYKRILEPLTGIVEDPNWDSPFIVPLAGRENACTTLPALKTGIENPPSYIVRILFCGIGEFQWSNGDKSAWEIRVIFKGTRYRIWDHKRSSWSIGPIGADTLSEQQTDQLIQKIRGAAKRLDNILEPELTAKVNAGNFYLFNSFRHPKTLHEKLSGTNRHYKNNKQKIYCKRTHSRIDFTGSFQNFSERQGGERWIMTQKENQNGEVVS